MREERGRGQQRPHHFHMFNLLEESFALLHKGLPPVTIPDEGGRREGGRREGFWPFGLFWALLWLEVGVATIPLPHWDSAVEPFFV